MKVAVVIPTRNEARTIATVTTAADAGLAALGGGLIVNADGGGDDGTGAAFLATPTRAQKRLLAIDGPPGKGCNLLAAWKLCLDEGVDAVVTLDGDMTTVQPWWIEAFVRPIAEASAEYVSPLYRRSWYRVVTARNVSRAFLYAWFGTDIQHPLSGNAAISCALLQRLVAREWTAAQLRYGVETAVVTTLLGDGRPWATAQLDICKDADRRFGHRNKIIRDVLTATVEIAREFAPRPGPGGAIESSPMTFLGGPAPETAWLEEGFAPALDRAAGCWRDYARWAGDRIEELEAAIGARRLDAALWFDMFARALLEARGDGRANPAADYAAGLTPLVSLRALTVWSDIAPMQASEVDANAAAEVPKMRLALAGAAGWTGRHEADAAPRYERRLSAVS